MSGVPERRLGPANLREALSLSKVLALSAGGAASGAPQRLESLHSPSAFHLL